MWSPVQFAPRKGEGRRHDTTTGSHRRAHNYAKGEPIDHISGHKIQLKTPLDFLAVTDHSEVIGVALAMNDPNSPLSKLPIAVQITSTDFATSQKAFQTIVAATAAGKVRLGEAPPTGVASTIQERAFSSPIWVAQ